MIGIYKQKYSFFKGVLTYHICLCSVPAYLPQRYKNDDQPWVLSHNGLLFTCDILSLKSSLILWISLWDLGLDWSTMQSAYIWRFIHVALILSISLTPVAAVWVMELIWCTRVTCLVSMCQNTLCRKDLCTFLINKLSYSLKRLSNHQHCWLESLLISRNACYVDLNGTIDIPLCTHLRKVCYRLKV